MKYFILLFLFNCNLEKFFLFKEIFKTELKQNPKIVLEKKIEHGKLVLLENGNSEIVLILEKNFFFPSILFQKIFLLQEMGIYSYSKKKLKWIPSEGGKQNIIQNIEVKIHGGREFIYFEFLSNEPPLELFSVPMILLENKILFNGLDRFKENKELIKTNRIYPIFKENEFYFYSGEDILIEKISF